MKYYYIFNRYSNFSNPCNASKGDAGNNEADKLAQEYQHVLVATFVSLGQILGR